MTEKNNDAPKIFLNEEPFSNNDISQPVYQSVSNVKPVSFKTLEVYDSDDEANFQNPKLKNSPNISEKTNNNLLNFSAEKESKENIKMPDNKNSDIEKINRMLNDNPLNDSSFDSYPDEEIPTEQFTRSPNYNYDKNNFNNPVIEKIENFEKLEKIVNIDNSEDNEKNENNENSDNNKKIEKIENKEKKEDNEKNENNEKNKNNEKNENNQINKNNEKNENNENSENSENNKKKEKIENNDKNKSNEKSEISEDNKNNDNSENNESNDVEKEDDKNNNPKKASLIHEYLNKNNIQKLEQKVYEKENDNLSLFFGKEKNDEDNSVTTPFFGFDSSKVSDNDENNGIMKKIEPIKINMEIEGNFVEKLIKELEEVEEETWGDFGGGARKKMIVGGRYNNNRNEDELEAFSYPYKDNSLCFIW